MELRLLNITSVDENNHAPIPPHGAGEVVGVSEDVVVGVCVEDIVSELVPLTVCVTVAVLDGVVVCEGVPEREGVDVEVSVIVFVLLGLFEGVCVEDIVSELVGLCEGVCVDDIVLELVPLTV